ncbi:cysteine/O-acetylserine transporter [Clostridium oceanicum]|uniref:Cysteine/O-acetylserine transporter n=1 Tax=Clostridium oceanicum TaxID=1543 RepID=A0ABP3UM79_9CLOT
MPLQVLLSFLTYTFITAFTPGPNNIVALSNTSIFGFKKSKDILIGIGTGFLCVMLICGIFSYSLASIIPRFTFVMKYIGALYVLWLAFHVATSKPVDEEKNDVKHPAFMTGFLLQFVNIKIILYGITALTSFVLPYHKGILVIVAYACLLTLIGIAGNIVWAFFGAVFQKYFKKYYRPLNISMALLLIDCAYNLVFK